MAEFDLEQFIGQLRAAASTDDAVKQVRGLMTDAFKDHEAVREAMAGFSGEEEILFEDDTVSIYYAGFDPAIHVPPHDHQTTAFIGVYQGTELNHFYLAGDGELQHKSTKKLQPGDVISMGPDAIHSVESTQGVYSLGIHVYLGPLARIERSLFDWETGMAMPFTDENYAQLQRPANG